jgi:hypothetical protein
MQTLAFTTLVLMNAVAESAGGGISTTIVVPGMLSPVRLGHPFRARYETERVKRISGRDERTVQRGTWYVDAKGRIRGEWDDDPAVQIDDPDRNLSCFVDTRARRVLVCRPLVGQPQPSDREPPPTKAPSIPSGSTEGLGSRGLGSREIAGLNCNGVLLKTELYVSEFWISIELGQIVLLRQSGAAEDVTYRLFDISLGDPDPQLFVIPEI